MTVLYEITGLVQGIGFRPFVAEAAEHFGIRGWVRNHNGIVTIKASAGKNDLKRFYKYLLDNPPAGAQIDQISCTVCAQETFSTFSIKESTLQESQQQDIKRIPADLPTCERCTKELFDPGNRRYHHPFISCVSCGPRYSILEAFPYDREHITMSEFALCEACMREYTMPKNVRRHAQTIACHDCGPKLSLTFFRTHNRTDCDDITVNDEQISQNEKLHLDHMADGMESEYDKIKRAADFLKKGGILAIKDIGGYHLACMPEDDNAVCSLRTLKARYKKPFAVLFPDITSLEEVCLLNGQEREELLSLPRPIVLLEHKKNRLQDIQWSKAVCMDSPYIGAMLPCNPVQMMLSKITGPLVMTSANRSGDLMIKDNQEMTDWFEQAIANNPDSYSMLAILSHNRRILTPLDDSVVRITQGRRIIIRRARGYVPEPVLCNMKKPVFAAGSDLKACFCYTQNGKAYLSQPFGDLQQVDNLTCYTQQIDRMKNLFGFLPEQAACDMHPEYFSSRHAVKLSDPPMHGAERETKHIPKMAAPLAIQHHHAHIASVIAEHSLTCPVLGVAFDGTGYGLDHKIWGSEFLLCEKQSFTRIAHLKSVSLSGGDMGALNADASLYGYLTSLDSKTKEKILPSLKKLPWLDMEKLHMTQHAADMKINRVFSSSMGRLFDAVSALLDTCHYNTYEGEAATTLEYLALSSNSEIPLAIELKEAENEIIGDTAPLFHGMIEALTLGRDRADIALGFHAAVSRFILDVCRLSYDKGLLGSEKPPIALAGGTFLNRILLERTIPLLEDSGFKVYINEQVPVHDAGLCLGQAYLAGL